MVVLYDQIYFESIINSVEKLTVIPVIFPKDGVTSKILMLKINGKVNYVLFSKIPDSPLEDQKDFNGKIIINNLNGEFINGFRVENGYIISRLVKQIQPITKCEDGYWVGFDMDCLQFLDETIIIAPKQEPYIPIDYIYPDNSGGNANPYYYDFLMGPSGGSSAGDSNTTEEDYLPEIEEAFEDKIDDSNLDECLKKILDNLKGHNHGIGKMLEKFNGNYPNYNWNVKSGVLPENVVGRTSPYDPVNGSINTTFSSQFNQASDLSWARTILHEAAHAYLATFYATARPSWIATYPEMVDDWGVFQNWNDVHHEEFSRSLVKEIAVILKEYGQLKGYDLSDDFYTRLSWGGLEGTSTFNGLSDEEKAIIKDIIRIELTGKNSDGEDKPQMGVKAGC